MPCKFCGSCDHNAATCILRENLWCLLGEEPIVEKVTRPLTCSQCGCVGHNKRTCSQVRTIRTVWCGKHVRFDDETSTEPEVSEPEVSKRAARIPMDTHKREPRHVKWSEDTFSPRPSRTRLHLQARKIDPSTLVPEYLLHPIVC